MHEQLGCVWLMDYAFVMSVGSAMQMQELTHIMAPGNYSAHSHELMFKTTDMIKVINGVSHLLVNLSTNV